jgi:hypothetical protein
LPVLLVLLVLLPAIARAELSSWSYLVDRLVADGVDAARATRLFGDPRVPPFTGLEFGSSRRRSSSRRTR